MPTSVLNPPIIPPYTACPQIGFDLERIISDEIEIENVINKLQELLPKLQASYSSIYNENKIIRLLPLSKKISPSEVPTILNKTKILINDLEKLTTDLKTYHTALSVFRDMLEQDPPGSRLSLVISRALFFQQVKLIQQMTEVQKKHEEYQKTLRKTKQAVIKRNGQLWFCIAAVAVIYFLSNRFFSEKNGPICSTPS